MPVQMDPALVELQSAGDAEVEAILRLLPEEPPPPEVRVVARFGDLVTVRLAARSIEDVREAESVLSAKAPRVVGAEPVVDVPGSVEAGESDLRPTAPATGRGVVVGVLDWGCDFAHSDFRDADGSTRLLAIWDQRAPTGPWSPEPYRYGRVHTRAEIDAALASDRPYEQLGYHPGDSDPGGTGTHGTHVLSIAAGGGGGSGPVGVAPDADLVFVHLATRRVDGLANLGDSVSILEALDFVDKLAGEAPCVVNASVGRHGGPHDGSTLVEQALDWLVTSTPGRCIVQSCGNYYERDIHTAGRILPGGATTLRWTVDEADVTPNELEVWYSGHDRFGVQIAAPHLAAGIDIELGAVADLPGSDESDAPVGRAYHRSHDPNNGRHHVDVFLTASAPAGTWEVRLAGDDVVDGRFHSWVERDATCPGCQSHLDPGQTVRSWTTGTICNSPHGIAVGAYDAHDPAWPLAPFSSSGPTVDGRQKPECLAPGVAVLAARSASLGDVGPTDDYVRKSGTSMAAPFVAGTVACMYEAAGRPLSISEVRAAIAASCTPELVDGGSRSGAGYLDAEMAIASVVFQPPVDDTERQGAMMDELQWPTPAVEDVAHAMEVDAVDASAAARAVDAVERLGAARVFDTLVYGAGSLDAGVAVVAEPLGIVGTLAPTDVVIRRGLSEGAVATAVSVGDAAARGWSAAVVGERVPADTIVVRFVERGCTPDESFEDVGGHACAAGEGPPAPEPDPSGGSLHPLVFRGVSSARSRRPSVGYAQQCLNRFLSAHAAGTARCRDRSAAVSQFVEGTIAQLRAAGQLPLVVDCRFGLSTQRATLAFQACMGIARDGKIGRETWPLLEVHAPIGPTPPVPPQQQHPIVVRWAPILGPAARQGNAAVGLIDGPETFRALHRAIDTATGQGHYIYLLGWWLDLDEPLDVPTSGPPCPPSPRGGPSTVRNLLSRASRAGVQVRVILWDHTGGTKNTGEVGFINGLSNGAAILDNHQHAFLLGSQHQKMLVVKGSEGLIAFCGGIDINCDRVCPAGTCPPSGTSGSASGSSVGQPLHDVHSRITGPAARDMVTVFVKRWHSNPSHVALDRAKGALLGIAEPVPAPTGNLLVRIGETYNARADMPGGVTTVFRDRTVQETLLAVIGAARRYIYIEDQYLISICAAEAIRRALPRVDHVTILIAASEISDLPRKWELRKAFIDHILTSPHRAKLRVFTPCDPTQTGAARFGPHTYVHTKTLIADDEIAVIGSANMNRRGWEHDSEIVAAIAGPDATGSSFAEALRIRLWSEHLRMPAAAVADPIRSKGLWRTAPRRRVCDYVTTAGADSLRDRLISVDQIDPGFPLSSSPCCRIHRGSCPPPSPSGGSRRREVFEISEFAR